MDDVIHRKRGMRCEKKQRVEFLPPNERAEIQSWARPNDFVRYGRRALVGLRADDVKAVSIERLCVSLSACRKTFNSKGLKSFVTSSALNLTNARHPLRTKSSGIAHLWKSTFFFRGRNSNHCFFSNLNPRFRCVTSPKYPGPNFYVGFLFWHLWMTHPLRVREHLR